MKKWWPLFVLLGLVAAFLWGGAAVDSARDFVTRGKRLTTSTMVDGVVEQSIETLVSEASADLGRQISEDAYTVARMLRSEYGSGPPAARVAMAWVARNDAVALGHSITWTINAGNRHGIRYGSQAGGRYSTAHDPYENDLAIAEAVLSGEEADPTGGAVKFVHKDGFGVQVGTGSYDSVVASWGREGLSPVELDGTGSLVVFVRDGGPIG